MGDLRAFISRSLEMYQVEHVEHWMARKITCGKGLDTTSAGVSDLVED